MYMLKAAVTTKYCENVVITIEHIITYMHTVFVLCLVLYGRTSMQIIYPFWVKLP